jgi:hypothetical protein
MAELSKERATAQAWEMLLGKAREAYDADPKAASAAKTLLHDPAWKQVIEAGVTASPDPEAAGTEDAAQPGYQVPAETAQAHPVSAAVDGLGLRLEDLDPELQVFLAKLYELNPQYRKFPIPAILEAIAESAGQL